MLLPTPPTEQKAEEEMEVEDEKEGDEPMDEDEEGDDEEEDDEFDEEILIVEVKRRPSFPRSFVVVPDAPEISFEPKSLAYPMKTTRSFSQTRKMPEMQEDLSCVNIDRKVTILDLRESDLLSAEADDQTSGEAEEYVDENGVRVRRIVKRTITTRSVIRTSVDGQRDEPQPKIFESAAPVYLEMDAEDVVPSLQTREIVLPEWMVECEPTSKEQKKSQEEISWLVLPSEPKQDEPKEERDRDSVRESVTATNLNREIVIPEIDDMEDESPQEIEEYIDENGVRARRIVKRTITTTSVVRTSVDDQGEEPQTKIFESAAPVYLEMDAEDVVPSLQTREVVLPEWMVESEPTPKEQKKSHEEISWLVLPSAPREDEPKKERDLDSVRESVTATNLNREIVIPEIDETEDESPQEIEEYIDENGVRVRRIVKRTITTRTIKREGHQIEPMELTFPVTQRRDQSPEEVEEFVDVNGVRVRRIVKRTITTRSVVRTSVDDKREEPQPKVFESAAPVFLEMDPGDVVPSVQTREVVLPEWMVESEPTLKEQKKSHEEISWLVLPSAPREDEPKKERDLDSVRESVTATTLNREIVIPEIDDMDESPEQFEEYVDDNGVRVRRIVRRTITTRTIKREGHQIEPMELTSPVVQRQDESPEEVEEYVDENGVRVRRIVKRTITTRSVVRRSVDDKGEESQPKVFESAAPVFPEMDPEDVVPSVQTREVVLPEWMVESEPTPREQKSHEEISWLVLPSATREDERKKERDREGVRESVTATNLNREIVIPEIDDMEDKSPEQVEEYVDDNGVRVRRIVRRTITTKTIKREGHQIEPLELTFPVAQRQDESPEEVEEYVDENGVRVRQIVKRTIKTRSLIRRSVDDKGEESQPKIFESAAPVFLEMDPEDVITSVETREVALPEWMVESEPTPKEQERPREEISWFVLPSEPREDEPKEVRDLDSVRENVTATTLNREIVIPEIGDMEDESPVAIEEYVDDNGVRVRRIVKRTVITRTIKREGQQIEPVEMTFPVAQTQDESPGQVEEYVDENGVRVKRMVRQTITTTSVQRRGVLETSALESAVPVATYRVVEEAAPGAEMATLEAITPEAVLLAHVPPTSPRRASMPYETTVVQRYLVIIETLYQYVLEHKSMIFIYSSRHVQFNFVLENFLYWMLVTLKTLSWIRPVSWKVDENQEQLRQIKVFLPRGTCLHLHEGIGCQRC